MDARPDGRLERHLTAAHTQKNPGFPHRPDRREGVAGTNDATSTWCAYTASADGRPVTVAVFDHPANARPARWFTMESPFAYLGATPGLHHESLTLRRSKPLRFRYGIAVWDGQPETRQIDALARRWVKLPAAP